MQLIIKFSLVCVLLIIYTKCQEETNEKDLIKKVITNIINSLPELKDELESQTETCEVINNIIGTGFTTYKQQADMVQYNGVSDSNLNNFLNYLKGMLKLPEEYDKYFVENLSLILFSDFNEIVIFRVLFSQNTGGDCHYVCVMGQRNEVTGNSDWLVGNLGATFTLAPDVFYIEKSVSRVWGTFSSYEKNAIEVPKTLSEEQLSILFKFFEVVMFERFGELLDITPTVTFKFLK